MAFSTLSPLLAVAMVAAQGCKRETPPLSPPDASPRAIEASAPDAEAPRCRELSPKRPLGADAEVGNAVRFGAGMATGVTRKTTAGRVASVLLSTGDLVDFTWVDLGKIATEAPPPRVVPEGENLYALYHEERPRGARALVAVLIRDKRPDARWVVAQEEDDSLAFDVAVNPRPLVVWDEDAIGKKRGQIRGALLAKEVAVLPPLSPPTSDAETPRLLSSGDTTWLVWVSRREVQYAVTDKELPKEGPSSRPFLSWLEVARVDGHGAASEVKTLTSPYGRVVAFDIASNERIPEVVFRSDEAWTDHGGGALLRIAASGGPVTPLASGVGTAIPRAIGVGAFGHLLVYVDTADATWLAPWPRGGAPLARRKEPALTHASVLFASDGKETTSLVAEDGAGALFRVECTLSD